MFITLYHYTTHDSHDKIVQSKTLRPSYRFQTLDSTYGDGHYLTDMPPHTSDDELFALWGRPLPERVQAFIAFQIDSSLIQKCAEGIYRLPLGVVLEHSLDIGKTYTDINRTKIMIKFLQSGHRKAKNQFGPATITNTVDWEKVAGAVLITAGVIGLISLLNSD
jgi:hypothetical protein